jgi:hypothetical protein
VETTEAPPRPRYRNDAIYRSAQKLLATGPITARRRPSRWLVFVAGITLGLVLAVVAIGYWSRDASGVFADGPRTPKTLSPVAAKSDVPHRAAPPRASTPLPQSGSAATIGAPSDAVGSASNHDSTSELSGWAISSAVTNFLDVPAKARLHSPPRSISIVTPFVAELILRGELRTTGGSDAVAVEFVLRRLAPGEESIIVGTVTFLPGEKRSSTLRLTGTIKGRTISVQEIASPIHTRSPAAVRHFVIELPADRTDPIIAGEWSFGTQSGVLGLAVVPAL